MWLYKLLYKIYEWSRKIKRAKAKKGDARAPQNKNNEKSTKKYVQIYSESRRLYD